MNSKINTERFGPSSQNNISMTPRLHNTTGISGKINLGTTCEINIRRDGNAYPMSGGFQSRKNAIQDFELARGANNTLIQFVLSVISVQPGAKESKSKQHQEIYAHTKMEAPRTKHQLHDELLTQVRVIAHHAQSDGGIVDTDIPSNANNAGVGRKNQRRGGDSVHLVKKKNYTHTNCPTHRQH